MLEMIDTADDIVAMRIVGTIESADLDRVMDRLDAAMAAHDKVHVFVETRGIDGIALSGLGHYVTRAMPLLGKLNRFGRVAVVADQAWIRMGTQIESAMLPFIAYRVFEPEQSDEALAWVEGRDTAA